MRLVSIRSFMGFILIGGLGVTSAHALTARDYLNALRQTNAQVEKLRQFPTSEHSRGAGLTASESGVDSGLRWTAQRLRRAQTHRSRSAEVGNSVSELAGGRTSAHREWVVIAARSDATRVVPLKALREEGRMQLDQSDLGVFRYVLQDETAEGAQLLIQSLSAWGVEKLDPRIASLQISTDSEFKQRAKSYALKTARSSALPTKSREGSEKVVSVSADGLRSGLTELEFFPLDVPRLELGEGRKIKALPELPQKLKALAKKAGFKPRALDGYWFEEQDFFGRPVDLFWCPGDPWPTYLRTPQGVAILVRSGDQS